MQFCVILSLSEGSFKSLLPTAFALKKILRFAQDDLRLEADLLEL